MYTYPKMKAFHAACLRGIVGCIRMKCTRSWEKSPISKLHPAGFLHHPLGSPSISMVTLRKKTIVACWEEKYTLYR